MMRSRRRRRFIFWRNLHTLPINLAIKRSSLPGVSYGIWSKEYIPIGTRFGPYSDITNEDLGEEETNDHYSEAEKEKNVLDIDESQEETRPNWLGYINCTRNETQQNLLAFHLQRNQGKVELYYLNYKPIPANRELLIWHRRTYTKTLGIEKKDYTYPNSGLNSLCYSGYSNKTMTQNMVHGNPVFCFDSGYSSKTMTQNMVQDDLRNSVFCFEISSNNMKKQEIVYNDLSESTFDKRRVYDQEERLYAKQHPFLCYICYYGFSSIKELQVHIREHAGESTYECDICHKVFSRIYSLHSHKMTHSKDKPYECKICSKRYSQKSYLKKHTKMHLIEEARLQYLS